MSLLSQKCIVNGCVNHTDEGTFINGLCGPCHHMITTGRVGPSTNFIREMSDLINRQQRAIHQLLQAYTLPVSTSLDVQAVGMLFTEFKERHT